MLPMERERAVRKSVCEMLCLIAAQFIYLMSGSAVFMWLERDSAQREYREALESLIELRKTLNLTSHQEKVLQYVFGKGFGFNDTVLPKTAEHAWDFISTLYFSITSTTTIGYGHHSPSTGNGQIFCIAFSLMGIPLHMVTLGTIGRHLNTVISRFLNWSAGKWINDGSGKKVIATFIVTCTLLILFTFFSAGSVRLMIYDISYTEAIYFIYVTISTIGFGDFVIRFEEHTEYNRVMILCLWALALYIGMAILSATIMSISSRAKQNYKIIFNLWNTHVLGKTFKSAKVMKRKNKTGDKEGLIMVDKQFLIAQLDMQTDPEKRAEIQRWIDMYMADSDEYSCDGSSYDIESDYMADPEDYERQDLETVN